MDKHELRCEICSKILLFNDPFEAENYRDEYWYIKIIDSIYKTICDECIVKPEIMALCKGVY